LRELGGVGLVELAAVLTGVPVYAARYGDATVAADAVIRLLRS
jgi:hypothetical protein